MVNLIFKFCELQSFNLLLLLPVPPALAQLYRLAVRNNSLGVNLAGRGKSYRDSGIKFGTREQWE